MNAYMNVYGSFTYHFLHFFFFASACNDKFLLFLKKKEKNSFLECILFWIKENRIDTYFERKKNKMGMSMIIIKNGKNYRNVIYHLCCFLFVISLSASSSIKIVRIYKHFLLSSCCYLSWLLLFKNFLFFYLFCVLLHLYKCVLVSNDFLTNDIV